MGGYTFHRDTPVFHMSFKVTRLNYRIRFHNPILSLYIINSDPLPRPLYFPGDHVLRISDHVRLHFYNSIFHDWSIDLLCEMACESCERHLVRALYGLG